MISLQINGQQHQLEADPAMPLLWALLDLLGLTGTKYNGKPVRRLPIRLG